MMVNLGTPALLFGAIALIMLAYTNRFVVLAKLVRDMHVGKSGENRSLELMQIPILRLRIKLIKLMQALGVGSFLLCTLSMFLIFVDKIHIGKMLFGGSVILLMLSLLFSFWEILISTNALDLVLDDLTKREKC